MSKSEANYLTSLINQEHASLNSEASNKLQAATLATLPSSGKDESTGNVASGDAQSNSAQKKTSAVYHLHHEDMHFYMVKVTNKNVDMLSTELHYRGGSHEGIGTSGYAFAPKTHYEINKALVWVAFVTDKPWLDRSKIDKESTEMFVSMITSEHAKFTTHAGIERAGSYKGKMHKDLAVKLHSFVAQVTLEEYPSKLYMINTPVGAMRPIIVNAFYKQGMFTDVFMGYRDEMFCITTPTQERLKKLDEAINKSKDWLEKANAELTSTNKHRGPHFWNENDWLNVLIQKLYLAGKIEMLPVAIIEEEGSDKKKDYIIYDQKGEILHQFTQPVNEEYQWLFAEACLIRGNGNNLLTCKLQSLAKLANFSQKLESIPENDISGDTLAMPYTLEQTDNSATLLGHIPYY